MAEAQAAAQVRRTPEHRAAIAAAQRRRHERNRRIEELIEELHALVAEGKRR